MLRRIKLALVTIFLVTFGAAGCASQQDMSHTAAPPAEDDASIPPMETPVAADAILLRDAMVPTIQPQVIRIQMHDERRMTGETFPPARHSIDLDLQATLQHDGRNDRGETRATLRFDRIIMTLHAIEPKEMRWTYDSALGVEKQNNGLATLMAIVADAECSLLIGPSGRLREFHGLDARWRRAGALMAPPALLSAQWQFRDIPMRELLSEAIFPPMPASPVHVDDAWEVTVPANLPLQARIDARLRSRLDGIEIGNADSPVVSINGEARLSPADDLIAGQQPAIVPVLRSGTYDVTQQVMPATHGLSQHRSAEIEADLIMQPPTGGNTQSMKVRRTWTIDSSRHPAEIGAI